MPPIRFRIRSLMIVIASLGVLMGLLCLIARLDPVVSRPILEATILLFLAVVPVLFFSVVFRLVRGVVRLSVSAVCFWRGWTHGRGPRGDQKASTQDAKM
jgi:hypothetical protein